MKNATCSAKGCFVKGKEKRYTYKMANVKQVSLKADHKNQLRNATTVVRNSLILLLLLAIIKGVSGYLTNIIALAGDALGSITDVIATMAIFIGLKASQQKASNKFKYGMHRIETLVTFIISIFIIFLGGRILTESIGRFFLPVATSAHGIGIIAAGISIIISVFTFYYEYKTGTAINSKALIASAFDKRNDALLSCGVLVGVIAEKFTIPYIESTVSILVAAVIIWSGVQHGYEAMLYLLDYWDNPEITKHIKAILEDSRVVMRVKNIRLRHAGTYIYGEAFIEVSPFVESKDLRDELHRLEKHIEDSVEHLGDLVLFIDPPKPTSGIVAVPIQNDAGLASNIATDIKQSFKLLIIKIINGRLNSFHTVSKNYKVNEIAAISKSLIDEKVNILVSSLITPTLYYNLRLNNIKVYPHLLTVSSAQDTLKLLLIDL